MIGNNQTKTTVSVVSLLNSAANQSVEKTTKPLIETLITENNVSKIESAETTIWSTLLKNTLPTVANTNLLYKSIPSTENHVVISHIVPQLTTAISTVKNLSLISTVNDSSNTSTVNLNNDELISPRIKSTNQAYSQALTNANTYVISTSTGAVCSVGSDHSTTIKFNSISSINGPTQLQVVKKYTSILVPPGWNRILDKDSITYISPNRSRLQNRDDVNRYLAIEGTCKCGLECPLDIDKVFNFDRNVASKFGGNLKVDDNCKCNLYKKFIELYPSTVKLKGDKRGRKPGQKNKRENSVDCTSPDRKRISLTGVSPLEMFQSGMSAINSQSAFAKNEIVPVKKFNSDLSYSSKFTKSKSNLSVIKSKSNQIVTSNPTFHQHFSKLNVISSTTVSTATVCLSASSISSDLHSVINSLPAFSNTKPLINNSADILTTSSIKQKKPKKVTVTKPRGTTKVSGDKKLKKVLPGVEIQKASELQLHQNIIKTQGKKIFIDSKSGLQVGAIPSLQNITSKNSLTEQVANAQALLTTQTTQSVSLQSIYKTLQAAANNQNQLISTNKSPSPSKSSTANTDSKVNSVKGHVIVSMPPNLTVSSANHLNEALLSQLTSKGMANSSFVNQFLQTSSEAKTSYMPSFTSMESVNRLTSVAAPSTGAVYSNTGGNAKQVNTPIYSSISKQVGHSQSTITAANGPMLLLHFVSQPNLPTIVNPGKIHSPVLRTYSLNNQTTVPTTVTTNVVLMRNRSNSTPQQYISTTKQSKTNPNIQKVSQDNKTGLLQIQNINTLQGLSSQLSPSSTTARTVNTIPVHYLQTVTPNLASTQQQNLKISQTMTNSIPLFQYLPTSSQFVYSNSSTVKKTSTSPNKNFVRIAPGPMSTESSTTSLLQQIEKHNNDELRKIQEELFRNPVNKSHSPKIKVLTSENSSKDSKNSIGKSAITSVIRNAKTSPNITPPPIQLSSYLTETQEKLSFQNTQQVFHANRSNISSIVYSSKPNVSSTSNNSNLVSVIAAPSTFAPAYVPLSNSLKSKTYHRARVHSVPPATRLSTEESHESRRESLDEMLLKCNEKPISNSLDDKPRQNANSFSYNRSYSNSPSPTEIAKRKNEFASSLVWIESQNSLPWPGRTLSASQLQKSELPPNQMYVIFYGSHHIQPVNMHSLKSFFNADLSLRFNLDSPKYRGDKSLLSEHEKAIAEALQDVALMRQLSNR